MIAVFVLSLLGLAAVSLLGIDALAKQRDAARHERDTVLGDLAAMRAQRDDLKKVLVEASDDRDAAYIERNAAIEAVRWVPLTSAEINRLAKTGCATCFGAGYTDTQHASGVLRKLCDCVQKKMRADRKYGFGDNGTPLRLAIPTDNVPTTTVGATERN